MIYSDDDNFEDICRLILFDELSNVKNAKRVYFNVKLKTLKEYELEKYKYMNSMEEKDGK